MDWQNMTGLSDYQWLEHKAEYLVCMYRRTGDIVLTQDDIKDLKELKKHHQVFMFAFNGALNQYFYYEADKRKARALITRKLAVIYFEKESLFSLIKQFLKSLFRR